MLKYRVFGFVKASLFILSIRGLKIIVCPSLPPNFPFVFLLTLIFLKPCFCFLKWDLNFPPFLVLAHAQTFFRGVGTTRIQSEVSNPFQARSLRSKYTKYGFNCTSGFYHSLRIYSTDIVYLCSIKIPVYFMRNFVIWKNNLISI